MGNVGAIPGMLNPGVRRDMDFLRERRVDEVLNMWKASLFERPSHLEMTWPNGDTAALHTGTNGFHVVITLKESVEEG